jgi:DNA repair exonuclease SbcCD ATPase subunit
MILLKTLTIKDFLSHENTKIDFNENQKVLLDGKSGSGKSSITDAILWCLYSKGRSENRSLVRRGTKTATVTLKLVDGLVETNITRSISNKKNIVTVTQNTGAEGQFLPIGRVGIKDIQEWIEKEFLKASYELFTNSIAYPQDREDSFVKATASKRKDLLLEIIGAGSFDDLYEKTKKALNLNELDNAGRLIRIEAIKTTIKHANEWIIEINNHKKIFDTTTADMGALILLEKELEKEVNNISLVSRQLLDEKRLLKMLEDSIKTKELQISSNLKEIEDHNNTDIQGAREDVQTLSLLGIEIEKIEGELKENAILQQHMNAHLSNRPQLLDYTEDIETMNKRLIPLIGETGKCPAGDECPFVKPIQGQIDYLTEQITLKTEKFNSSQKEMAIWEKGLATLPPIKDITLLYKVLKDTQAEIGKLEKSKETISNYELFGVRLGQIVETNSILEREIQEHKSNILSINEEVKKQEESLVNFEINKTNAELSEIRINKQNLQKTLDNATYGIKMGESATITLKEAENGLESLVQGVKGAVEEKESLELLKEALSPRGVKAVVVDYIIPQLEERINSVLSQMSDFRIRLDTQKALASDDGTKEGLFITIINDQGEELAFENYSGGEKIKITIAISEALASIQNNIGFRIIDENIVSLDAESTEGFVDVLLKLQEKYPQLLIISHIDSIKDLFEKRINCVKINGISKIT